MTVSPFMFFSAPSSPPHSTSAYKEQLQSLEGLCILEPLWEIRAWIEGFYLPYPDHLGGGQPLPPLRGTEIVEVDYVKQGSGGEVLSQVQCTRQKNRYFQD